MLVSSIDAEAYRLFRFTGSDRQRRVKGVRLTTAVFFSLSRRRALAEEHGISGFPRFFKTNTSSFVSSALRPVVILRQCWKGVPADSPSPASQSFEPSAAERGTSGSIPQCPYIPNQRKPVKWQTEARQLGRVDKLGVALIWPDFRRGHGATVSSNESWYAPFISAYAGCHCRILILSTRPSV